VALDRRVRVLAVNAGSSSLKLSLVDDDGTTTGYDDLGAALAAPAPDAVGHRVVHGGTRTAPVLLDDAVVRDLTALTDLAPLHQPAALQAIQCTRAALPDVPQVACFDTAFHRTIPPAAHTYALPARLRATVRVYGFHGLSVAWSVGQVARLAPAARRVVVAHLGSGASLTAVLDGRSVDTTMGFTPTDGLVMGSRSGHLDPGAVAWLGSHGETDLTALLEQHSGLVGLAGTTDLRTVLEREAAGDADARLAVQVWLHRFTRELGGLVAVLGGLDALVFTGGVGEHAAGLRARACARLGWLGVELGAGVGPVLSAAASSIAVLVVPAREDLQVAAEVRDLLAGRGH